MITIPALVAALVELLRRVKAKDYYAVATIIGAGVIGGLVGYLRVDGVTVEQGVVAGLSASGLITIVQNFGQKSVKI